MTRRLIVEVAALLLAVQIVRTAAVEGLAPTSPQSAARVWSDHPLVLVAAGMTEIATATALRRPVDREAVQRVIAASQADPLRPEPFLVRGVEAQLAGDFGGAERAFRAAEWRDGRSLPARYFLADQYLRRGDADRGLKEVAVLSRLTPQGPSGMAPYVAAYARSRDNWPRLRTLFRSQPMLAEATLSALAEDPANSETVLALGREGYGGSRRPWFQTLLTALVNAQQYERARVVWGSLSPKRPADTLLVDPDFKQADLEPPFNWSLTSSTVGLAERQRGGGLHAIFYGQEDGALASQLLLLKPGEYRFEARPSGASPPDASLQWRLTCAQTNAQIRSAALAEAARGWRFQVPDGCQAQRLELFGVSPDVSHQTEVTIPRVTLVREAPNG